MPLSSPLTLRGESSLIITQEMVDQPTDSVGWSREPDDEDGQHKEPAGDGVAEDGQVSEVGWPAAPLSSHSPPTP